jgi:nucleotide-binding universal stress UspA family protein
MAAEELMEASKPYVIVVGIDYSPAGDLALNRAFELATEKANAEVHIVHVLQSLTALTPMEGTVGTLAPDAATLSAASEQLRRHADQRLQQYRDRVSAQGKAGNLFQRAVSHLRLDAAAHEIAQLASDLEADLVIVGTHGRRGAARLLLGSVAESVVRLAPCPVLVERHKTVDENVPRIEPPCPRCVDARRASGGKELWCSQHRERHAPAHTYHYNDRSSVETNFPLTIPE